MEEDKKALINEEYIMSIVSDSHSGQAKVLTDEGKATTGNLSRDEPEKSAENLDKIPAQEIREPRKRKSRQMPVDYESQFIKKADLTVRSGKGVYIRSDYHSSINRIISVIGNNEISITDYLDNILTHHFEYFEQEITDVFDKKYKPIIRNK